MTDLYVSAAARSGIISVKPDSAAARSGKLPSSSRAWGSAPWDSRLLAIRLLKQQQQQQPGKICCGQVAEVLAMAQHDITAASWHARVC